MSVLLHVTVVTRRDIALSLDQRNMAVAPAQHWHKRLSVICDPVIVASRNFQTGLRALKIVVAVFLTVPVESSGNH